MNRIYVIRNLSNNKVYVGQTSNSLNVRFNQHCATGSYCVKLSRALKKYGRKSFVIELLECVDSQKLADKLEIKYINLFDSINSGYNLKSGGSFGKHSIETKKKMSLSKLGVKRPDISKAMKGKKRSKEFCKKVSLAKKGKPNGLLGKKRTFKCPLRRIPVYCVDENGVERYFESVVDAEVTGCSRVNIRKCIIGKRFTSGQFRWYSLFGTNKLFIASNNTIPVECVNEFGVVKRFRSIIEGGKMMGVSTGNIYSCVYGTRFTAGGFMWRRLFMLQNSIDRGK